MKIDVVGVKHYGGDEELRGPTFPDVDERAWRLSGAQAFCQQFARGGVKTGLGWKTHGMRCAELGTWRRENAGLVRKSQNIAEFL